MFLRVIDIDDDSLVTDIVKNDYRTSAVFRKYDIEYCCTGKVALKVACDLRGLDKEEIKKELNDSVRNISISNAVDFNRWDIDFLIDYIRNIHHAYLQKNLPEIAGILESFANEHQDELPWVFKLLSNFRQLNKIILPHLEHEEQVIFPYIKQVAHAYESKEPYAALLVRTLRKPVEDMMHREHQQVHNYIQSARKLTANYVPPANACISQKVCLARLRELDNDLVQHTYLENNILFPKAIAMEKEMLLG